MNKFIFPLCLWLLLAASPALRAAGSADTGLQAAQQELAAGDYKLAYTRFSRHATNNPLAQFSLGLFHRNGWGRPVDNRQACQWFEKAAQKRIPAAQHYLGDCLVQGTHRQPDPAAALELYMDAAAGGHLISLCAAADLYIRGEGVSKDVQRGLELCTQAAQANSPPAQLALADYYRNHADIPSDLAAARYWYQQAAERRLPEAQYRLGVMLSQGQGGTPDLDAALLWLETAASAGHAPAYLPTAVLYANAEPDPATGALRPEHLAKIYLWTHAAKARTTDPTQRETIARIETMLQAVMPETWHTSLDQQIAAHLAKFSP